MARVKVVKLPGVAAAVVQLGLRRVDVLEAVLTKRPQGAPPKFIGVVGFAVCRACARDIGLPEHQTQQTRPLRGRGSRRSHHLADGRSNVNAADGLLNLTGSD